MKCGSPTVQCYRLAQRWECIGVAQCSIGKFQRVWEASQWHHTAFQKTYRFGGGGALAVTAPLWLASNPLCQMCCSGTECLETSSMLSEWQEGANSPLCECASSNRQGMSHPHHNLCGWTYTDDNTAGHCHRKCQQLISELLTFSHLWLVEANSKAIGKNHKTRCPFSNCPSDERKNKASWASWAFLLHNCTVGRILNRSHLP